MSKLLFLIFFFCTFMFSKELINPIPIKNDYDFKKAQLGKKLFFDNRLSGNNTISCATCHILKDGGADHNDVAIGIDNQKGTRNSPTVLNARYNKLQFWDGRANTLKEQALEPIHSPIEMNSNFKQIVSKLQKDEFYKKEFLAIYKTDINTENIIDAIVEFEKALTTPNSRFDKYLRGDTNSLTKDEKNGFKLFKDYGCISCHNGINIGGNLVQKIGIVEKYNTKDFGLYSLTKNKDDKFYFKVPTLRNIELTAPYFHDGKIKTLDEAVNKMIKYQVGFVSNEKEQEDIVKFLKTLTGDTPYILKEDK